LQLTKKAYGWYGDDWRYFWSAALVKGAAERGTPLPCSENSELALCLTQFLGEQYKYGYQYGSEEVALQLTVLNPGTMNLAIGAMLYIAENPAFSLLGYTNSIKDSFSYRGFSIEVTAEAPQTATAITTVTTPSPTSTTYTIGVSTVTSTVVSTVLSTTTNGAWQLPDSMIISIAIIIAGAIIGLSVALAMRRSKPAEKATQ
jgi:hypothetical protein